MLTYWPTVSETETLYSIVSRLHVLHGVSSAQQTSRWLFGFPTAGTLRFSPRNLDHFNEAISRRLGSASNVLRFRTPAGQFFPFVAPEAWNHWVRWCQGRPSEMKPYLGLRSFGLPSKAPLRCCMSCAEQDSITYGSSIWRLEHQLIETKFCIWHQTALLENRSSPQNARGDSNQWLRPEDSANNFEPLRMNTSDAGFWRNVARINWLLTSHMSVCATRLRKIANQVLVSLDISGPGRRIDEDKIRHWWNRLNRPSFGSIIHLEPFENPLWIKQLLLQRRDDHPLKWAVLLSALLSADDLSIALEKAPPLQMNLEGKWDEPNAAKENLLKPSVWKQLISGTSISEVSRSTGIESSKIRHALRLNPERQQIRATIIADQERQKNRNLISTFLQAHPHSQRADLLRTHSAALRWLELHDWPWITGIFWARQSGRFVQKTLDFASPSE